MFTHTNESERLKHMSLEEKVGQLFTLTNRGTELTERTRRLVAERKVGGIFLDMDSLVTPEQVRRLTAGLQCTALEEGAGLPLFISADFVAGAGCKLQGGAVHFPKNKAIGAAGDESLAYESGRITAKESLAMGVNFNYSPVVDINNNPDNPVIGTHSFGEERGLVARLGRAVIQGYQEHGLIATAKHFPGHGDTNVDSHLALPVLDFDTARLESFELYPFREAIDAGVEAIMVGHIAVPAWDDSLRPASLSKEITTGWLRERLGFKGLIVTDGLSMKGVTAAYALPEACVLALEAGADILLATGETPEEEDAMVEAVVQAVRSGRLPLERIEASVARILKTKERFGLSRRSTEAGLAGADFANDPAYEVISLKLARKAAATLNGMRPVLTEREEGLSWTLLWDRQTEVFRDLVKESFPFAGERCLDSYKDAADALQACGQGPVLLSLTHNKLMDSEVLEAIRRLSAERKNVYLVHFGSGYDLRHLTDVPVLLMYDRAPSLQKAAAEYVLDKELQP
ncbi:glycoside hydrolase family 3 N-terminal domain-containing protein [Paenibacillus sp. GD4]|uniref:glycoside hydrolase family 3 protein n=1 Tax=Paenibacillus sp. GD4 TaxID=3068890 RepID=UPI0027967B52|nr:glycoside hydrolase family 3 N-terminal domain-containing protein [Paenibacillus sp. GD4]MDQ1910272.1 glycoside hydrolase family 3 N-terminal domain-containing protein [Paenibacillus sp. GD4]